MLAEHLYDNAPILHVSLKQASTVGTMAQHLSGIKLLCVLLPCKGKVACADETEVRTANSIIIQTAQ